MTCKTLYKHKAFSILNQKQIMMNAQSYHTLRYRPVGSFSTKSSSKSGGSLVLNPLLTGNAITAPASILGLRFQKHQGSTWLFLFCFWVFELFFFVVTQITWGQRRSWSAPTGMNEHEQPPSEKAWESMLNKSNADRSMYRHSMTMVWGNEPKSNTPPSIS